MRLTSKKYKITKTKNYLKKNNSFLFFNSTNKKSNSWSTTEQNLKKINFDYYKIFNKTSKKTLTNSIYKNVSALISSITFFVKLKSNMQEIVKLNLTIDFNNLSFILLAFKLNSKVYSSTQVKNTHVLNYKENKLLFFQFQISNLKLIYKNTNLM